MLPAPIDFKRWIDEHRHLLKPPVGNKCIYDGDFIVMVVGGPNARTDYHWEEGPEWFYQIEGEMVLRIQEDGRPRDIPIRAGEIFLLPPRVPHSPQRMPDSIALVIERKRLPHEDDGLMWFCEKCNHKLYEECFFLDDLEKDFAPVFERSYASRERSTRKQCRHPHPAPAKYGVPDTRSHGFPQERRKPRAFRFSRTRQGSRRPPLLRSCNEMLEARPLPRSRPVLRSLIDIKPRDVPFRVAARNTIAVVAPLAVGLAIDQVPAALAMTTGAMNTMFTDQPGPYRQRMQRMAMASTAAGLSALVGILVGGHSTAFVLVATLAGLLGGLLVALGPVAARVGLTSMIVMLVTADMKVPTVHAPAVAALVFAGGLLQMLMAVAAWPLQRYRPERFALATVLRQLADVARTRPDASQPPPVSIAAMDALQTLHGEYRSRGRAMQSFRIIAELCERVRVDLLALGDLYLRIDDKVACESLGNVL